ncbi:MAG TPA: tRNA pseudouridine(13) synthase TruD [Polyangiaceae bacterium]
MSTSATPPREPHVPPFFCADLPAAGGRIGPSLEDFVVDEIPAYAPSGTGDHWYVRVRKRGVTTRDAVLALARAANVPERDIGYAGMKDKHGVTTQWLSLPGKGAAPDTWALPSDLELVEVSRHTNKLRTGHLRGNRFRIALVATAAGGEAAARQVLERLAERGHVNQFGAQRFGRGGRNLSEALDWLSGAARLPRGRERFLSKLYASAAQSEVFNRYATRRVELGLDRLLRGEVVRLSGAGAMFVVESPEAEVERLRARDIVLTGPLPGPKMRAATDEAERLERELCAEVGLDERALVELARNAPGTRRDLLVFPERCEVSATEERVVLAFELPAGSYATMVVREVTRSDDAGDGREGPSGS